jgi:hypothetical protein
MCLGRVTSSPRLPRKGLKGRETADRLNQIAFTALLVKRKTVQPGRLIHRPIEPPPRTPRQERTPTGVRRASRRPPQEGNLIVETQCGQRCGNCDPRPQARASPGRSMGGARGHGDDNRPHARRESAEKRLSDGGAGTMRRKRNEYMRPKGRPHSSAAQGRGTSPRPWDGKARGDSMSPPHTCPRLQKISRRSKRHFEAAIATDW